MAAFAKQQTIETLRSNLDLRQAVWDMAEKERNEKPAQHNAHVNAYDDYCIANVRKNYNK